MKKIYTILSIILLSSCLSTTLAQDGNTTSFMRQNPYFGLGNPASFTPYKGYIGLPVASNINLTLTNTAFHYKNIFATDSEGYPTTVTVDKFISKLNKNNWLNLSLNEEVLGFGFRVKRNFFTFSYRIKAEGYFKFSEDLLAFPLKGNMSYLGDDNPAELNANISLNAYQEFSIGAQIEIGKRLYIGVRPKFLLGLGHINTQSLNATIYTNPTTYEMRMDYNADVRMISVVPISINEDNSISFDMDAFTNNWKSVFDNMGFGIDVGAIYRINDIMGVGVYANDLGFIKWKGSGVRVSSELADGGSFYQDGSFKFDGLSVDQIQSLLNDEDYRSEFVDSLGNYFPYTTEYFTSQTNTLNAKFGAEFYYQPSVNHRLTAAFQGTVTNKAFYPRFTLAYNGRLAKVFDICLHYSIMPGSYTNLGVGLGFDLWPIYLYVATDNIFAPFNFANASNLNIQAGFVFKWGRAEERKIKETIKEPIMENND